MFKYFNWRWSHNKNWVYVVERSVSLSPEIEIINDVNTNTTTIKTKDITILKAQQLESSCIINEMNLTPLGLNITGDVQYL